MVVGAGLVATLLIAMSRNLLLSAALWPIAQIGLTVTLWQLHQVAPQKPAPLWRQIAWACLGCAIFAVAVGLQYARVLTVPALGQLILQLPTLIAGGALLATLWLHRNERLVRRPPLPRMAAPALFALLLVPAGWFATQPQYGTETLTQPPTLRVVSYNIRQGFNNDGWANLEALAQAIERENASVVLLQEVSRGVYPNASMDIPEWLSRRLGMPYHFAIAHSSQFGNATLTRLPIEAWETDTITESVRQPRNYLRLQVDIGLEAPAQIINTHLDHLDSAIRQEQIDNVLDAWGGAAYTLIGGDFNAQPDAPTIVLLEEAGLVSVQDATGNGDLPTYPAFVPRRRLDYIFATSDWALVRSDVPETLASDHLPVVAEVGISASQSGSEE